MLLFAIFTLGYFAGVFTALFVFPPNTKELREQEIDAVKPVLEMERELNANEDAKRGVFNYPAAIINN